MIRIRITRRRRVDCRATLRVPLSVGKTWGQLRDFPRFARQEFFHAGIDIGGGSPREGAELRLAHHFFLFRVRRVGRICRWREGIGFTFSDLSLRGPRRGFPHVFGYTLRPISASECELTIRVAGLWTATFIPRWLAWLWLRWVMQFAVQSVGNELELYRLWLGRRSRTIEKDVGVVTP